MAWLRTSGQIGRMKRPAVLLAICLALTLSCAANAEEGKWQFLVEPYLMFPNMKGEVGVADLPAAPVDEDPSDIFDHLQMGAMFYFEAHNDQWMFSSDLLYMDLESDLTPNGIVSESNSRRTSSARCGRASGSLAKQRMISTDSECGTSVETSCNGFGSRVS